MPLAQRRLVHGIAEQYSLASASSGQEPRRGVELFKTGDPPTAGLPNRLLSRVAATVPDEEIAALVEAAAGFPVRFVNVAPTADLHYYLRRWEGAYTTEWKGGAEATVRFAREADRTEALDAIGGGIRGLFRIDRQWRPRTAVAAVPAGGAGAGAGEAAWTAAGRMGGRSGQGHL